MPLSWLRKEDSGWGSSKLHWKPLVGRMHLCHSGWYNRGGGAAKGDADRGIYHVLGKYMEKCVEYLAWK